MRVIWIFICSIQQYCPWTWLQEIKHLSLATSRPFLVLQSARREAFSSCWCCSLLVPFSIFGHPGARCSQSKPRSPLQTVTVLSLGSGPGSGFSASSRALCFRISTRSSSVTSWSWEFRNWTHMQHRTYVARPQTQYVSAERRNTGDYCNSKCCYRVSCIRS